MKKNIPTSIAVLVVALVVGGVGVFYYAYMVRPQKYTIMVDPMIAGSEKQSQAKTKSDSSDDSGRKARRDAGK